MKAKVETKRCVFNLPLPLFERLQEYANYNNVNLTAATCGLLTQAMDTKDFSVEFVNFMKLLQQGGADLSNLKTQI